MPTPESSSASSTGLYSAENLLTTFRQITAPGLAARQTARPTLKVLLVQPPVQDFYDTDVRLQPIGLAYLKAAVNKDLPQVEVIIKDFHAGCGRKTVKIPQELKYLTDYY